MWNFSMQDILDTNRMITEHNLDVRTITMGINLCDCSSLDIKTTANKIYDKILYFKQRILS